MRGQDVDNLVLADTRTYPQISNYLSEYLMKRLNPITGETFKRGDIRDDGYIFQGYIPSKIKKDGYFHEKWISSKTAENQKRIWANQEQSTESLCVTWCVPSVSDGGARRVQGGCARALVLRGHIKDTCKACVNYITDAGQCNDTTRTH